MQIKVGSVMWLIATFFWSLFMGVTAISIGFGALFPSMNQVAAPFVCPNGKMVYTEDSYNPYPGTTYTNIYWYCVDNRTGEKEELGIFPMAIYAGLLYGLVLFVVIIAIWYLVSRRQASKRAAVGDVLAQSKQFRDQLRQSYHFPSSTEEDNADALERAVEAQDAVSRMKELKRLRDSNLISDAEYEQKRSEILKDL